MSFRNIVAVRIGLLVASVASMLDALSYVYLLIVVIWSAGAGFASVWLYRRTTGHALSVGNGARMGWITGVLNSVIIIVLLTLMIAVSASDLTAMMRQQVTTAAGKDPAMYANAMAMMNNPATIPVAIIMFLFFVFVIFTSACVAGGALGARFTRKDIPPA